MSAFADVKDEKTLNEWLDEIAFVTSTMSDPDEPHSFQEPLKCFCQRLRLCSCGTKPQRPRNHQC